ncbi:hypothetical protein ONS95_012373 [Cadophora gregata]|uniref:uncharacterized protein n=1 Tax=Cadophora gregata TaxID=51156 RepID=UPI0026DCEF67|nr:uncharacterized protein ONS95_012373 [Cadophora gregata]KAK0118064.1 hypothetical protein ONS95_012373 [Cadophora gregata]KAK0123133.1 hypothetical protein ONS96_010137 [Cadophora gregata f. sp. sojae]
MAALLKESSGPESNSKPSSRRRHHARTIESRSSRRLQNDQYHHSMRNLPPRQMQWSAHSPMMTTTMTANMGSSIPLEVANGITMERTPSGNSIMSDTSYEHQASSNNTLTDRDNDAARRVEYSFNKFPPHRKHERILRKLIQRDDPRDDGSIDDDALLSILNSANAVFFDGVLSGRVQWEWSSQSRYHNELIGTTALRPRANGDGFETLIVLSSPILKNPNYDRRLLLSAFLHELIHCYLFILCGFEARRERGHTKGFHAIAEIIDNWVGPGYLSLCNMKANLNHFRKDEPVLAPRAEMMGRERRRMHSQGHGHEGCHQSPRPDSVLVDIPDVRPGYF